MRLGFLLSEIGNGLRRNTSMFISVMLVTMVAAFFMGAGLLAQQQVDTAKGYWYDRVQVSIFMCTPMSQDVPSCAAGAVTDGERAQLRQDLEHLRPLVKEYWHEDADEAYDRFREQFRNSPVLENVPEEAIPESFRVQLSDPTKAPVVVSAFEGAPGVESVEDPRRLLDTFFSFLNVLTLAAAGLAAAMALCSVLLISTTIRQTAWSRRRETGIMRLVGASASVIRLPFLAETVLATLLGSGLAVGLLWLMVHYGVAGFLTEALGGEAGLMSFIGTGDLWSIVPVLVGGAVLLAIVTSWVALRRHLRV